MSAVVTSHDVQLQTIVCASPWFMRALHAARDLALPSWCIGAGAVRNLVWDHLHGYRAPSHLPDVDMAYFDAAEPPGEERFHQARIARACPDLPWDVVNQAHVHHWFARYFGHPVRPLLSFEDAVASWPEFATSVGVSLAADGALEIIAPCGLDDLFAMRIRRNPARASVETFRRRTAGKRYAQRWPLVTIQDGGSNPEIGATQLAWHRIRPRRTRRALRA